MKKRVLSLALALIMVLSILPMTAMAKNPDEIRDEVRNEMEEDFKEGMEDLLDHLLGPDWPIMPEDPEWPEKPAYPNWGLILEIFGAAGSATLNDVDHVAYLMGYEDGRVRPNATMTRAEAATIFFRLLTDDSRKAYLSGSNPYDDVSAGDWYHMAVSTLYHAGVLVDSKYHFRPNDPITRAELAVMASRFVKYDINNSSSFTDVPSTYWAAHEIAVIETMGWIKGYPDGSFHPDAHMTRSEVVTVINRMLGRAVKAEGMVDGMVTFRDCSPSDWFYADIQEATNTHTYTRTAEKVAGEEYSYEEWRILEANPDWTEFEKLWG